MRRRKLGCFRLKRRKLGGSRLGVCRKFAETAEIKTLLPFTSLAVRTLAWFASVLPLTKLLFGPASK